MKKSKIKVLASVTAVASFGAILCACQKSETDPKPVIEPGPESGEYYCEISSDKEYTLTLSKGTEVSLSADYTFDGTYTVNGSELTFKYDSFEVTALYDGNTIKFTYNDDALTFWRDVNYTVTFDGNGGGSPYSESVRNGKTVARPTDPEYDGHGFIGWFTDKAGTLPYAFDGIVTDDMTLYAKWAQKSETEYAVGFKLGYDGAPEIAGMTTIGNRLYNVPEPKRDGYTFRGWWISQYDDGERLSYVCGDNTVFDQDTTLYALWQKDGGKADPAVNVTSSNITWDRLSGPAKIKIEGPDGFDTVEHSVGMTVRSEPIAFADLPAGDYVIELTVGDETYTRHYKNKALAAVSGIRVTDNSVLNFGAVKNAERYIITVDCGDETHEHKNVDIGSATTYDFSSCEMRPEGINFTVYAQAEGYASGTPRSFNHEAHLDAVSFNAYDEETGVLSWAPVDNAGLYKVQINNEDVYELREKTSVDLRKYSGVVTVRVYAEAHGYNSVAPSVFTRPERPVGMPTGVKINGTVVTWSAATNAASYIVTVNGNEYTVENKATSLDLAACGIALADGETYEITVQGVSDDGASRSYRSDTLTAKCNAMSAKLGYEASELTWDHVIGATEYEVQVNDGEVVKVAAGTNRMEITLTAKDNTLKVRGLLSSGSYSEWASIKVRAYEISFDAASGKEVESIFKAHGDKIDLPMTTRTGYDFKEWYTAPQNGVKYSQSVFTGNEDMTLYAMWEGKTYTVTLNYGRDGAGEVKTVMLKYGDPFKLPVPEMIDKTKAFINWNAAADGNGTSYSDYRGYGKAWNTAGDVTLYARYLEVLQYEEDGDGCAVKKGAYIGQMPELVIPSEYNGKKVVAINDNAFSECRYLVSVTVPDTVRVISETAFSGCVRLERYAVEASGTEYDPVYSADEQGVLIRVNPITKAREIAFIPNVFSGTYTVSDTITHIGTGVFNKTKLTEIIIPYSVTKISVGAFDNSDTLTTITFLPTPEGKTAAPLDMHSDAIKDTCKNLSSVTFPARLQSWGDLEPYKIFSKYKNLETIFVEKSDDAAYQSDENGILLNGKGDTVLYCPLASKITEYIVPSSVTAIGANAFNVYVGNVYASNKSLQLTRLVVHGGVREIGDNAFYRCGELESVIFTASKNPAALTIGKEAFARCSKLTTLTFEETGSTKVTEVNGKKVYTFVKNTSCGVVSIGEKAFYSTKITSVLLPVTLNEIKTNAFNSCTALSQIDLSHMNSDLVFGNYVFSGCSALTSIDITNNVGVIDFRGIFKGCSKLKSFNVSPDNPNYETDADGILYSYGKDRLVYIPDGVVLGDYKLDENVVEIGSAVFQGRNDLTSIVIPERLRLIGGSAFDSCLMLSSVRFENPTSKGNPLVIDDSAFRCCYSLESIDLPARTVSIGSNCFAFYATGNYFVADGKLEHVGLNEGLQSIGSNAFFSCMALNTITIPSTVTLIDANAFQSSALVEIKFTQADNAPELTFGNAVFSYCSSLGVVRLPERLQYIPERTFAYCGSLSIVTIPTTVGDYTSETEGNMRGIGSNAFGNCSSLYELTFTGGGTKPLSFAAGAFYNCGRLTALELPNRIAAFSNAYDVFEMGSGSSTSYANAYYLFNSGNISSPQPGALQRISVEKGGAFESYDGVLYTKGLREVVYCPGARTGEVTISKFAETFRPNAFGGCAGVTSVVFEDAELLEYTDEAGKTVALPDLKLPAAVGAKSHIFGGCKLLTTIVFPARLAELGNNCLKGNTSAGDEFLPESITFANGCKLKNIGDNAFASTAKLINMVLPKNVESVGATPFSGSGITSLTVSEKMSPDDILKAISGAKNLTDIKVPENNDSVVIEDGIMYAAEKIKIKDGETETEVNARRIVYCYPDVNFENLVIPADVYRIESGVFKNKTVKGLMFAKPAEGEPTLPFALCMEAFSGTLIESIEIPARLTSLEGTNVFAISTLKTVTFEAGYNYANIPNSTFATSKITTIDIPDCVTKIGMNAFSKCTLLKTVNFGSGSRLKEIGSNAFNGCAALIGHATDGFVLPDTVTEIGANAFQNCKALAKFTFTNTDKDNALETLPANMFNGCTKLNTVVFPKQSRIKTIGDNAFKGCTALATMSIPDSVTKIGVSAFEGCTVWGKLMTDPVISENSALKEIGNKAFFNCKGLKSVYIPATVTKLGYYTSGSFSATTYTCDLFSGCTSLATVTFGSNSELTAIGKKTFYGCTSLEEIVIPTNVTAIGESAFEGCTALENVTFKTSVDGKSSLEYIGKATFKKSGVTSVTLPYSLKGLGLVSGDMKATTDASVFRDCSALKTVVIESRGEGAGTLGLKAIPKNTFLNCTSLDSITLASTVNTIYASAFAGCTALKAVDLSNIVTLTGLAFSGCSDLSSVTLGSVESYDPTAFQGCSADMTLTISAGGSSVIENGAMYKIEKDASGNITDKILVAYYGGGTLNVSWGTTAIAAKALKGNTSVTGVVIPATVKTVNADAFGGCSNLASVAFGYVPVGEERPDAQTVLAKGTGTAGVFYNCTSLSSVDFTGVVNIGDYAFCQCTALTDVDIKDVKTIGGHSFDKSGVVTVDLRAVTSLGTAAFMNCKSLASIVVPGTVTTMEGEIFSGCDGLMTAEVHAKPTVAKNSWFKNCSKLETVLIGKEITVLGSQLFLGCEKLISVTFEEGSKISEIGYEFFKGCKSLRTVVLPESLEYLGSKTIGASNAVFADCAALESIKIPKKVTWLGKDMFKNCTNLASVDLNMVTELGQGVFTGCYGVTFAAASENASIVILHDNIVCRNDNGALTLLWHTLAENQTTVSIENDITALGNNVFIGNTAITEVVLPASVSVIGTDAFNGCKNLTSINLNNVSVIGVGAFNGSGLTSVEFSTGASVAIHDRAFYSCSGLTELYLPSTVSLVSSATSGNKGYQFSNCTNLKKVTIDGVKCTVTSAAGVFSGCAALTEAVLTDVTVISNSMFASCSALTDITLPTTLIAIGTYAFSSCAKIPSVFISSSVTSIGERAFGGWVAAQTIYVEYEQVNKPTGWHNNWDTYATTAADKRAKVLWGQTPPETEEPDDGETDPPEGGETESVN